MSQISLELVYEHLARKTIEHGLPKNGDLPPLLLLVRATDTTILDITPFPESMIFFTNNRGKAILGKFLDATVPTLPPDACIVLIHEAYYRRMQHHGSVNDDDATIRKKHGIPQSLKDDPKAVEVVMFSLYRPGVYRTGCLPISPDRTIEYQPLDTEEPVKIRGRLVPESTQPRAPGGARPSIFIDAQEMQRMNPATFEAPAPEDLAALRVGMSVRLCAADRARFWVTVTALDGDNVQGKIAPPFTLANEYGLKNDDKVSFELRHIYRIE